MTATEVFLKHAPGIREALRRCGDPRTITDVVKAILSKEAQVWGNEEALVITQLAGAYVHFWIVTGELEATLDLGDEIIEWARGLGYTKATATGRKGWAKVLANSGWRQQAILMEKNIG
jgi:hypothetical protein